MEGVLRDGFDHIHAGLSSIAGASRTDAGVHAAGQSVSATYSKDISPEKLFCALNGVLPEDVRIVSARTMPDDFHATRDAIGKHYVYTLYRAPVDAPCTRHIHWWIRHELDVPAMNTAIQYLIGTRDFAGIYVQSRNQEQSTVRTVDTIYIQSDVPVMRIHVFGRSFMYKMVRSLTGILYAVGRGRCVPEDIPDILNGDPSARRSQVAPPHGLSLVHVYYDEVQYHKDVKSTSSKRYG